MVPDTREVSERVRTPLLTLITQQSLDEDYQHVAERKAAAGEAPRPRKGSHRTAAIATAVFGIMVAIAAVQTSRNQDTDEASRATLLDRIETRRETVADLQERMDDLRRANAEMTVALSEVAVDERATRTELGRLGGLTGARTVTGPGVRFTLRDSPDGSPEGRVRASDLRLLVNGLWQAGAEAIGVNGHRLGTTSAITTSGTAVIVHGTPLSPPYVVRAVGDRRTLQAQLFETSSGVKFQATATTFGFVVERQNDDALELNATPPRELRVRYAKIGSSQDRNAEPSREEQTS